MKPVYQEFHGEIVGDCLRAAVASLLEMPLNMVPHFALFEPYNFVALNLWLDSKDMYSNFYYDHDGELKKLSKTKKYIGIYTVPESDFESHAVIIQNKKVIHDPSSIKGKLKKLICVIDIQNKT